MHIETVYWIDYKVENFGWVKFSSDMLDYEDCLNNYYNAVNNNKFNFNYRICSKDINVLKETNKNA